MSQPHGSYADPYAADRPYRVQTGNSSSDPYHAYNPSPTDTPFQVNPSNEKIIDAGYPQSTERLQKGRQGLNNEAKSWATNGPPPRSTGILRMWRKGERGKQWSRGGGLRTFLRLCCCCTTFGIILAISIILTMLLYVRPPSIKLNNINLGNGAVSVSSTGFSVGLSLNIGVANPNWFNVDFTEITANLRYPGTNGTFGGGTVYNADFVGFTETTFNFPLTLNYSTAIDPNKAILNDLLSKCGSTATSQDITVNYDLHLKLRIVGVTISPTISSEASFACPISASDISKIGGV